MSSIALYNLNTIEEFLHFTIPAVYTWGGKDKKKRNTIRNFARASANKLPESKGNEWFVFLIQVSRNIHKARHLDIENVPKLIIDAFTHLDRYAGELSFIPDDNMKYVRAVHVEGTFIDGPDKTEVWIFRGIDL